MKTIKLNNGIDMPILGLGTFRIDAGESAYDTVISALKIGYRLIDTAQMYQNEASIGLAIKDSNIKREDIFITTKLRYHHGGNKELIKKDIENSLKQLQVDYLDLLLIHWPNHNKEINTRVWEVFEELYNKGIIRSIGVSNFQIHHLDDLIKHAKVMPVINQVELHPGLSQVPMQNYLSKHNIALESYGPLMKGKVFEEPFASTLNTIATKYNASIAQIVFAWGIKRGIVMIPKSTHTQRLIENFNSINIDLTDGDVDTINKLNRGSKVYTDPDNNPFND